MDLIDAARLGTRIEKSGTLWKLDSFIRTRKGWKALVHHKKTMVPKMVGSEEEWNELIERASQGV